MKKRKSVLLLLTAASLVFTLCACGGEKPDPSPTPTPATEGTAPAPVSEVKTGIVIEASMHTLTIEAKDGSTYAFVVDDNTRFEGEAENLGDTVSVEYEGEYQQDAAAKSVKVVEAAKEGTVSVVPEATDAKPTGASGPDTIKYITAVVKDASMNSLTVSWMDKDYLILRDDNTTVDGAMEIGNTVRIFHYGDIADGVTALRIDVVTESGDDIKYITGEVVNVSMSVICVDHDGHQYFIAKDDDTKSDSISVGDRVRVYHHGDIQDGIVATRIIKL